MNELRTDEEQAEALKAWWKENSTSLVLSVVIVAGGWFGWTSYQDNQRTTGEAAAAIYSQLTDKLSKAGNEPADARIDEMRALAQQLKADYDDTVYSRFGGLFLARFAADDGDFAGAEKELRDVLQKAKDGPLKLMAEVRLAAMLVQQGKLDDAIAMIPATPDESYAPLFNEIKGDALFRKGNLPEARTAYTSARNSAQALGMNTQALERKIDSLTTEAEKEAEASPDQPAKSDQPAKEEA